MRLQFEIKSNRDNIELPYDKPAAVNLNVDTGEEVKAKTIVVSNYDPRWSTELVRVEGLVVYEKQRRFCVAIYKPGSAQEPIGYVTIYTPEQFPE